MDPRESIRSKRSGGKLPHDSRSGAIRKQHGAQAYCGSPYIPLFFQAELMRFQASRMCLRTLDVLPEPSLNVLSPRIALQAVAGKSATDCEHPQNVDR